jgi:peroxiredoxin
MPRSFDLRTLRPLPAFALLAILIGGPATHHPAQAHPQAPGGEILAGDFFPAPKLRDFGSPDGREVDLSKVVGTKPVVLVYWVAGHERSESVLVQVQGVVEKLGADKVALFGLAVERPGRDAVAIRERIKAAGIRVPVLDDENYVLGRKLGVQSVPNIVILDQSGRLRLANGASLAQTLEYKLDLAGAIQRVAETGRLGTYGYLDRYFPVKELVGRAAPDFTAETLIGAEPRSWSSQLFARDKLNVLIFWSVDCSHCRRSLPEINAWLKQNQNEPLNVVSAAYVTDAATATKTKEFCETNDFVFPTLKDADRRIADRFQVTTTPTIVIVGPDGTVDSVLLSDMTDFGKAITDRKRALLKT